MSFPLPQAGRFPEERPAAVYLVRHGQTEWSESGRHTSRTDVPLTEEGEARAGRLGALLTRLRGPDAPPPFTFASPRRRATRTALLAGLARPMVLDELVEWDYGEYEGITTPEIRETVPGWTVWTHPCPGGETVEQVTARADRVLARVRDVGWHTDVVLVGHGHFSRVLAARWIGLDATAGVHVALDPGHVTVLGHERGVPRLDHVNVAP